MLQPEIEQRPDIALGNQRCFARVGRHRSAAQTYLFRGSLFVRFERTVVRQSSSSRNGIIGVGSFRQATSLQVPLRLPGLAEQRTDRRTGVRAVRGR